MFPALHLPPPRCGLLIYYYHLQQQLSTLCVCVCVCLCVCPDPPYLYLIQSREQRVFILVNKQRRESRLGAACCCWHELRANAWRRRDRRREDREREGWRHGGRTAFLTRLEGGCSLSVTPTRTLTHTGQSCVTSWCETAGVMMHSNDMGHIWQNNAVVPRNYLQAERDSHFVCLRSFNQMWWFETLRWLI